MGRHRSPEALWGNIPGRRHSRCRGPGTEQARLRHLPAFTAYGGLGDTHKWSSAALCGLWEDKGHRYDWRSRGNGRALFSPSFCALAHCSLAWGQRDQNIQTDRGEKKVKMIVSVAESCLTLCDIMDCNLPGSSVHGIFAARLLQQVAMSSFRRSSRPRY